MLALGGTVNAITPADNKAHETIDTNLAKTVNNAYDQYLLLVGKTKDNMTHVIFNNTGSSGPPAPTPVEICGDGIDNDGDGLVDEGCPVTPPPVGDKPDVNVNASKWLRVVSLGDIDDNGGLTTQLNLAKKYNAAALVFPGDYGYSNCDKILQKIIAIGIQAIMTQGNHDCCSATMKFNNMTKLYGTVNIENKTAFFLIDANQGFSCTSPQFNDLKTQMETTNAMYKIPVVHQPFVTVKSQHAPNGQFQCWDPLFKAQGVTDVLQAHNHNYQRIQVNSIDYHVLGTGTHDTGSSMYPLNSDNWNGFKCLKCITGTNGITIMDFQIDNATQRSMQGWFISNSEQVKDKFN